MSRVIEKTGAAPPADARAWTGSSMSASVWTPTRESASTLAFMSTLRLHSRAWQWVDAPEQARWWVVDAGAHEDLGALAAHYDRLPEKPRVAFLAAQLNQLPRPSWTFFKPPVKSGLVFNWVRPHEGRSGAAVPGKSTLRAAVSTPAAAPVAAGEAPPWRQGVLRLRRWPNMSRYGNTLELTVACSRLLAAPASYAQLLQWSVPAPLLDRLRADAHEAGLLQLEAVAPDAAAAASSVAMPQASAAAAEPAAAGGERSRWDLVKRLLGKFTRR